MEMHLTIKTVAGVDLFTTMNLPTVSTESPTVAPLNRATNVLLTMTTRNSKLFLLNVLKNDSETTMTVTLNLPTTRELVRITSSLDWWKFNAHLYPDLARMARDVLAVPASGSAVERVFSVSGRIATWQRNRLSGETISRMMMFKSGLKQQRIVWERPDSMGDAFQEFPIQEVLGKIPPEWENQWWLKHPVREEIMNMFPKLD